MKAKAKATDGGLFGKVEPVPEVRAAKRSAAKKTEVVRHEVRAAAPAVAAAPVDAFLAMIREVSLNPGLDVAKLDSLLAAQIRVMDRGARMAFDDALIQMMPKLPVITKDGKIVVEKVAGVRQETAIVKGTYAKWETIYPRIKPILHRFGFGLTHRSATAPDGRLRITAILKGHGHTDDSCYIDLAADATGNKNNAQAWASVLSYGKRHTACAVLGIVTRDEDDDAKKGGGAVITVGASMTAEQLEQLIDLAGAVQCPQPHLLKHLNARRPQGHPVMKDLAHLPASRFDEAVVALRGYEQNAKERTAKGGQP